MSANNQIKIWQGKSKKVWHVHEIDMDTRKTIICITDAPTLEKAIQRANDFMITEEVEYGLDVRV